MDKKILWSIIAWSIFLLLLPFVDTNISTYWFLFAIVPVLVVVLLAIIAINAYKEKKSMKEILLYIALMFAIAVQAYYVFKNH